MNTGNASLVQQARQAIKAGKKDQARVLLRKAIHLNEKDHLAWAWLATVTTSPKTSAAYAQRAAALKPSDPLVRKVGEWTEQRLRISEQAAEKSPLNDQQTKDKARSWRSWVRWVAVAAAVIGLLVVTGWLVWRDSDQTMQVRSSSDDTIALASVEDPNPAERLSVQSSESPTPTEPAATATPVPPRIQAKNIASADGGPRSTWTPTPTPTNTPSPTPTYIPTFVSPNNPEPVLRPFGVETNERWIDVDLSEQALYAYEGNELVFSTRVSSGTWQHPTVTGQFRIWVRYVSQTMDGRRLGYNYYLQNVPYVMYFYEDYALHGTYWHNNFGTPMSHGCVNLKTADAQWIYNWSSLGTVVNVHQ